MALGTLDAPDCCVAPRLVACGRAAVTAVDIASARLDVPVVEVAVAAGASALWATASENKRGAADDLCNHQSSRTVYGQGLYRLRSLGLFVGLTWIGSSPCPTWQGLSPRRPTRKSRGPRGRAAPSSSWSRTAVVHLGPRLS